MSIHQDDDSFTLAFCVADIIGVSHHVGLFFEIGSHYIFCSGWPITVILSSLPLK
jgi:hypothetical protein